MRRLSRLLVILSLVLAPLLVVRAQPAEAFVPAPIVPVAVEAATAAAAGAGVALSCAAVCTAAVAAAVIGGVAYATKDLWLPYAKDFANELGVVASTYAPALCTATANWTVLPDPANGTVVPQVQSSSPGCAVNPGAYYTVRCYNTQTGTYSSFSNGSVGWVNNSTTGFIQTKPLAACSTDTAHPGWVVPADVVVVPSNGMLSAGVSWHSEQFGAAQPGGAGISLQSSMECINSQTAATTTVTVTSAGTRGLPVPSCQSLGANWWPKTLTTTSCPTGVAASSPLCEAVGTWTRPTTYDALCPVGSSCRLQVYYQGTACIRGQAACVDWSADTAAHPSDWQCKYGPYDLPLSSCAPLEWAYTTTPTPITNTEQVDGNPSTPATRPAPAPTTAPTVTPAPTSTAPGGTPTGTAQPSGTPAPTASGSLAPSPGGGALPTSGTNPAPSTAGDPSPETDPDNCLAGAWSWNPVHWVMVPVQCALRWAWVPDPAVVTQTKVDISQSLSDTAVGEWTAAFGDLGGSLVVAESGCQGPGLDLSQLGLGAFAGIQGTVYPVSACSSPMDHVAAICKALLTLSVAFAGAMSCGRALSSAFGVDVQGHRAGDLR